MIREYRRVKPDVVFAPGRPRPSPLPDWVYEYRRQPVSDSDHTAKVLDPRRGFVTVTAEALDGYLAHLGGWVRVA